MPGGWEPGPRPQSVSSSQATLQLPTGFVQQGLCHRVYVTVCASCHPGSRSDLLTYLDSMPIPQNRQQGTDWYRISRVDSSLWWQLSTPLLDFHLFFLVNYILLSPPSLIFSVTMLLFWSQVEILSLSNFGAFKTFSTPPGLRAGVGVPTCSFHTSLPPTLTGKHRTHSHAGFPCQDLHTGIKMVLDNQGAQKASPHICQCFKSYSLFSKFVFSWAKHLLYQCFYVTRMN